MSKPQRLVTPRDTALDQFSQMISAALQGSGTGQGQAPEGSDLGTMIQNAFMLPAYGGPLSYGTPGQLSGVGSQWLNTLSPGGSYSDVMNSLQGMAAGKLPGQSSDLISQASSMLTKAGSSVNLSDIAKTLETSRQLGLTRDVNNIREQFSNAGLRQSGSLASAIGQRQSESQADMMKALVQEAPQLAAAQTGAGAALGGLGTSLGGLATQAGQAYTGAAGLPFNVTQSGLNQYYQDYLQRNSLFPMILSMLSGTPINYGPSLFSQITGAATNLGTLGILGKQAFSNQNKNG